MVELSNEVIRKVGRAILAYEPLPALERFHRSKAKNRWIFGGNRCLGGEQEIYDPMAEKFLRVDSIDKDFNVLSWNGRELVKAKACKPFVKSKQLLYRVSFSNGQSVVCSDSHLLLTPDGFQPLSELSVGYELFLPASNLGNSRSILSLGAFRSSCKAQDFLAYYLACSCSCDEQLHTASNFCQEFFPSQEYAQEHIFSEAYGPSDSQDSKQEHTLACLLCGHLSTQDALSPNVDQSVDILSHVSCRPCKSVFQKHQAVHQSMLESCHPLSTHESVQLDNPNICVSPHGHGLVFYVPSNISLNSKNGIIAIIGLEVKRFDIVWDFKVPIYHNYLAGGVIHHNSGKSEGCIGYDCCSFALGVHPWRQTPKNATIWAAANTWPLVGKLLWSEKIRTYLPLNQIQAPIVWHNKQDEIPAEIRLVNGNHIEFKAYEQGRKAFEGRAIDAFYGDEQIKSDSFGIWTEIQARLMDRRGFSAQSMTPVIPQPWLEERIEALPDTDEVFYADLNDNRKSRGGHINDSEIDELIAQWPAEVQETRVKGRFAAFFGAVYKTFNRQVHIIKPFKIPDDWIKYRAIDWGFNNPFCCLWLARDPDRRWYVYAEHYQARETLAYHAERIKQISGREKYQATWADHDAQDCHEFKQLGIHTLAAKKDVHLGIEAVQAALKVQADGKPRLFIFNTCKNTSREMPGYKWSEGTETKDAKDEPLKVNDHTCDCVRYGIYGVEGKFYFSESELAA